MCLYLGLQEFIAWIANLFKKHKDHEHFTVDKNPILELVDVAIEEANSDEELSI